MVATEYNPNIDELRVYNRATGKSVVYIQSYSNKQAPHTPGEEVSIEMLVWLATNYEEVKRA